MLARALGIALVLCLWNEFNTVQGQTASQVCEYDRACSVAIVYHVCYGWSCHNQIVIINQNCRTHDTCVAGSATNPAFGACSVTCGGGTQSRVNTCNRASATTSTCTYTESQSCNDQPCTGIVVNGNWGLWNTWSGTSACSATCCTGTQSQVRTRLCDNPAPSGGGTTCPGLGTETQAAGPCGSDDTQCPLTCTTVDDTFADTCRRCVNNHYTCPLLTPTVTACDPGEVWTQAIAACATPAVCNALEPQL